MGFLSTHTADAVDTQSLLIYHLLQNEKSWRMLLVRTKKTALYYWETTLASFCFLALSNRRSSAATISAT
jgi:hypothetical protein